MNCPLCGGKSVGKVGVDQFFCWDCCVEYDATSRVFAIAEDGSLMNYDGSADEGEL